MMEYTQCGADRWRAYHNPVTVWLWDNRNSKEYSLPSAVGDVSVFVTFGNESQQMYADTLEDAKKLAHEWIREKMVKLFKELGFRYAAFAASM